MPGKNPRKWIFIGRWVKGLGFTNTLDEQKELSINLFIREIQPNCSISLFPNGGDLNFKSEDAEEVIKAIRLVASK